MKIHLIAICSRVMHHLALALHHNGYQVTGSDDTIFEPSKSRLQAQGLCPEKRGWFPEKLTSNLDAIIIAMQVQADNPELLKAKELGIKIYHYQEFLFEHSKNKTRVVIGGSYGKTTISSMILHVMNYHNREVDYMIGAQLNGFDSRIKLTEDNDFIILEGDGYLCSPIDGRSKFNFYQPNIALLSGITWEPTNSFLSYENYLKQFRIFVDSIVEGGSINFNEEDEQLKRIIEASGNTIRKLAYKTHDYKVEKGQTFIETSEGDIPLEVYGKHNMNNLSGAKWICQHMGIDEDDFYQAIATFKK